MDPMLNAPQTGLPHARGGKVRELYDAGDAYLVVSTDRVSAFDVVFAQGVPSKGAALTLLSSFWFRETAGIVPNHLLSDDPNDFPPETADHINALRGRTSLVKKANPLPVECIVRGYLVGSGWKDYQATGAVSGVGLPEGVRLAERFDEPIFTPSTKAELGAHDENITFDEMKNLVGAELAERVREKSLEVFRHCADYADRRGVILADTKFEFGLDDEGELLLIDEVCTPDSSRYWRKADYRPGETPPSFDKQFLRDYLISIGFNKQPPPPELPEDVLRRTAERYREACRMLVGREPE
ncbi:MAG: phosphoribosylaminoimidazolesuccinocarboxamide synthase [Ignavibacteriales bacterium]|nr:phosphoribosylaminoimidazolesuccinocarboxamide synthase [Ignavibacteriales bacterium]